ncbi:MAG: hypothetical protein JNL60_15940 [Bacteroidia bacterium]|nr:hypothetical protein [Bacteroidia bacterium]
MRSLFIALTFVIALPGFAQKLFKGVGVFGALTVSKHEYKNLDTDKKDTTYTYKHFYPQSHVSKEFLNWGAGIFLELSRRSDIRWQTELEYMNKGAKELLIENFYTGTNNNAYVNNKLTYIQWNNYIKFYNPIFASAHWYFMAGVRLEYLFKKAASTYPDVIAAFPKFWFSGDLALGYEFPVTEKIGVFIEQHWNPDIIPHTFNGNTRVRARSFETRVGLVLRPRKRRIDDCNAPVYKGPAY